MSFYARRRSTTCWMDPGKGPDAFVGLVHRAGLQVLLRQASPARRAPATGDETMTAAMRVASPAATRASARPVTVRCQPRRMSGVLEIADP